MPGRQVGEQLDHGAGDVDADGHQVVGQPDAIEHLADIGLEALQRVGVADRGAEQQVLEDRQVAVVALLVERLDQLGEVGLLQAIMQLAARSHDAGGELGPLLRVDGAAQPELVDVLLEVDDGEDADDPLVEIVRAAGAERRIVGPVGGRVEGRVAGAQRLGHRPVALAPHVGVVVLRPLRPVAQAVEDVVADALRKQISVLPDIADAAAADPFGQIRQIELADPDRAVGRHRQPRQYLGHALLAAAARADDGDVLVEAELDGEAVKRLALAIVVDDDVAEGDRTLQLLGVHRRLVIGRQQALGRELLDHLLVLDLDVLQLLVPVDQLLHRAGQVLVGIDHRQKAAEVEPPGDREVAADQVEEVGRHLRQQVVERLDGELQLIDVEADLVDLAESLADLGPLVVRGVVDVDLGAAVDALGDPPGELTGRDLAAPAERQHRLAQDRDDDHLQRQHEHRDAAQPHALAEDEDQRGDRLAAEEGGLDEGVADEAAERLDLVLDHGRHLGLLDLAQMAGREAQDAVEQLEAQPAQHPLAEPALLGVDLVFEGVVDQHHDQEQGGDRDQVGHPLERHAGKDGGLAAEAERRQEGRPGEVDGEELHRGGGAREALALDRRVDDGLGNVERQEIEDLGQHDDDQDDDLIVPAVPQDIFEQVAFHAGPPTVLPQRSPRRSVLSQSSRDPPGG